MRHPKPEPPGRENYCFSGVSDRQIFMEGETLFEPRVTSSGSTESRPTTRSRSPILPVLLMILIPSVQPVPAKGTGLRS